ncbi:MAG: thioredoxin family protein [Planctomycetales bacterium]
MRAAGGKFNAVLKPGAEAPEFRNLTGTDGKSHSLAEFSEAKVVVLIFTRNHCPFSQKYEPRIRKIVHDFGGRGVAFAAMNSSHKPGEDLAAMRKNAEQNVWKFPYLKDETQQVARAYGATVTPQFFILGPASSGGIRKVVYYGALDDHPQEEKVQEPYLRRALEAVLAEKTPEVEESLGVGCELSLKD